MVYDDGIADRTNPVLDARCAAKDSRPSRTLGDKQSHLNPSTEPAPMEGGGGL